MTLEPDCEAQHDEGTVHHMPRLTSQPSTDSLLSSQQSYEEKYKILKESSSERGPSAFKKQSSFGSTLKLNPSDNGESTIAVEKGTHYSQAEKVDKWKKYNHLGQTLGRMNIVNSYGVLLVPPGPSDYSPKTEKRSTQRADPHWSMYDRDKYSGSVDALSTPGPGSYKPPPNIVPAEPYIVRHEKVKLVKSMDKIGPGSYNIRRTAEMATQRFHRETSAHLARRDNGSKTREVLDFNTLSIKKNKQKRLKDADRNKKSQLKGEGTLGPGTYFPLASEPPASVKASADHTLPMRKKFDHDPDIASTVVHTIGVRRPDFQQGPDQLTPGPGQYDTQAALYGPQPLAEAGGAVSRPGKSSKKTSDSEGRVKGQHAHINFATRPVVSDLPTMRSTVRTHHGTVSGHWAKVERNEYQSPYAASHKKQERVQRLVGRGSESTVQDQPFRFAGRQSPGAFFQFH